MDGTELGSRLRAQRERWGLSTAQAASALGVSVGTLNAYEKGTTTPDVRFVAHAAERFGVSACWLAFGVEADGAGEVVRVRRVDAAGDLVVPASLLAGAAGPVACYLCDGRSEGELLGEAVVFCTGRAMPAAGENAVWALKQRQSWRCAIATGPGQAVDGMTGELLKVRKNEWAGRVVGRWLRVDLRGQGMSVAGRSNGRRKASRAK